MAEGEVTVGRRFSNLWGAYEGVEGGAVEAGYTERAPYGSLRPDVKYVRAAGLAGSVLAISNLETTWREEDPSVQERLRLLELLAVEHPAPTPAEV